MPKTALSQLVRDDLVVLMAITAVILIQVGTTDNLSRQVSENDALASLLIHFGTSDAQNEI